MSCFLTYAAAFICGTIGVVCLRKWSAGGKCLSKARLEGKTVVITGCNTGIGFETAKDMSKRGARVIMACRNIEAANDAAIKIASETGNAPVVYSLDLTSLKSIRECADEINKNESRVDILINNAGIAFHPFGLTKDGFEMHMGTNHFGHFLFTHLLLDKLIACQPSRIVNVSSLAHAFATDLALEDLNYDKRPFHDGVAYRESKLANVLFTRQLSKRLAANSSANQVTTYSLHPGLVRTDIFRNASKWMKIFGFVLKPIGLLVAKDCLEGAQTTIYCAIDESLATESGKYYADCKEAKMSAVAKNDELAEELWKVSEKMVGIV